MYFLRIYIYYNRININFYLSLFLKINGLKQSRRKQFVLFISILAICYLLIYLNYNIYNESSKIKLQHINHSDDVHRTLMSEAEFVNAFKYHNRKANLKQ